jgi:hypothetical protein
MRLTNINILSVVSVLFFTIACTTVPARADANITATQATDTNDCLKDTDPGYSTWEALGKGDCWCNLYHCHGDADNASSFGGRYVSLADLNILRAEFGKTITELQEMGSHGCANFDHLSAFGRPVGLSDLNILKANYALSGFPYCPMTHLNFYIYP